MLTIDGKEFRNLEEQVLKNQSDIKSIINEQGVLNQFGIKVVGQATNLLDLPSVENYKQSNPQWEYGDTYAIGTVPPYSLYVLTRANASNAEDYWFNIGSFPAPGPKGEPGKQGPAGEVGPRGLQGPQGIQGIQGRTGAVGPVGLTGAQGVQGIQGPKGEPGNIYKIIAILDNVGQLPTPSEYTRNNAYIIDNHLYAIVGEESLEWVDFGVFASVQGPQGIQGVQGPTGPTAGSNPNLLINGDFRVNQRGQSSYTGTGYTVDRWRNVGFNNLTVTPLVSGLRLEDTVDTTTGYMLSYKFEDKDYLKLQGKTITISFKVSKNTGSNIYLRLLANGENVGDTNGTNNTGIFSKTITLPNSLNSLELQIRKSSGELNCEIEYAKVEIGNVITPFSTRPYAEELAMCQRYYQDCRIDIAVLANTITNLYPNIPLIQTLRTNPTITITTMPGLRGNGSGSGVFTISSITFNNLKDNSLQLLCKVDDSTPVQSNYVYQLVNGNLTIDAEIY